MWFGIIQVVGLAAGWAIGFWTFGAAFSSVANLGLGPNPTPAQVSAAMQPLFNDLTLTIPLFLASEFLALVVLTLAFRDLARVESVKFRVPMIFMILLMIGVAVAASGAILLIQGIPNLIAQVPTSGGAPSTAFGSMFSSLIAYFALIGIGALLALVGAIGGQILGLWRVGEKYNQTLIKVGAIFSIIPLLNIVAPILVLVGAYEAKGRLSMKASISG